MLYDSKLENGADPSDDKDYIVVVKMATLRIDPELHQ